MKQYIHAIELWQMIKDEELPTSYAEDKAFEGIKLAYEALDDDAKHVIRLSCDAELCEIIWP
jgi:uncharacterized protein (UPF0128 family)